MPFRAVVKNGKVSFLNPKAALRWQEWLDSHQLVPIIIEEDKLPRSMSQLRMYWAWVDKVATDTGNNPAELHEFLLSKCAPRVVATIKGPKKTMEVEQTVRTSEMDKTQMGEYMERCVAITGFSLPTKEELEAMGYISNY